MTHLYLIRHAQMDGLQSGIIGSTIPNAGLSPLGITQAEQLRNRLMKTSEIRADILISSPLRRARETAEIIAPALGLPVIIDNGVQELNLGEGEGLSEEAFVQKFGSGEGLDDNPFRRIAVGGDSWAEFTMRICEVFDRLTRLHQNKTIVIVCHGRVIEVSFMYFMGLNTLKQLPIIFHTHLTSITHWHKDYFAGYGRSEPQWSLEKYNDYRHASIGK